MSLAAPDLFPRDPICIGIGPYRRGVFLVMNALVYDLRMLLSVSAIIIARPEALLQKLAARLGFEPRQTDPESVVLPLHHRAR